MTSGVGERMGCGRTESRDGRGSGSRGSSKGFSYQLMYIVSNIFLIWASLV